jgi:MFS family permease
MINRYQSRAFLLLPMCANVGVIVGPLLGGITSDPATNYPDLFGGIRWLEKFPYSPPNLLSAVFLFSAAVTVFFVLEEVGASQTVLYIH